MKKSILTAICALFLFSGCGLFKKIEKSNTSDKNTEKTTESTTESTNTVKETTPTKSEIVLDISDLERMVDGFTQRIESGMGSASTIEKRDGKLYVTNTNAGSKETESTVATTEKETIYNSEFVMKETKKVISRLPWWIWLAVIVWLLIVFRKFISQILMVFFPGAVILKIFSGGK